MGEILGVDPQKKVLSIVCLGKPAGAGCSGAAQTGRGEDKIYQIGKGMKGWDDFSRILAAVIAGAKRRSNPRGLTRKLIPLNQVFTDRRSG